MGYGAPRGPGGAPYSSWGRGKVEGGTGVVRCLLTIPALPERTDCHPIPAPIPSLPPHPQLNTRWEANPSRSLSGWVRSRGGDSGRGLFLLLGRAQQWAGLIPGLSHTGRREGQKSPFPTPSPGLGGCPQPTTIPCPSPALSPPNNNQRKRKRCHLPMPALRVSKPSGMGGARQLLGAWRGGGLPGGGHGTAYLEPPSLPEHAHRPHTHHHGVS